MAAAAAVPVMAAHSWAGFHWSRTTTLNIKLADNVAPIWDAYLVHSSTDWTAARPLDTQVIQGTREPSMCDPTYGQVEVCAYAYGTNGWLGIANVWTTSDKHIVQAVVRLNDTYFASPSYNTGAWRRFVMCQEIGHALGLDHQDVDHSNVNLGSCMDYTSDPTGTKGTNGTLANHRPNARDYSQLNTIYGHTDPTQLASTKPSPSTSGAEVQQDGPAQARGRSALQARGAPLEPGAWGRAVANDRKGRGRVFVKQLPDGITLTTFVTWADPDAHDHHHGP